ncbi:leukotriene B4 receptor 1-like isoform X2 [Alosa sapidissima]|uniref:leukotriene B4 receptor 1-like isoform X2 n=1 Tax=Alosa sapidissima TaxID=34773 RepID=UPI001C0857BA|nr:leukotriene B4 receptor 1-like isoform X2 [Alosa sapidissima]
MFVCSAVNYCVASGIWDETIGTCVARNDGIPGNIVVVVVILRHFKKDNFTLDLMLNLAVSDILCLSTLPAWIYDVNVDQSISPALCKFLISLIFTSMYSDVLTVTLMSVQRYLVVIHRNQWAKLGRKQEKILLFCLWIFACILSSPSAARAQIVGQGNYCMRISGLDQETLAILLCETLLGFVLPFSIIVSSYYCLHKEVNRTAFFSNQRLTKLVTTIVVTFVILRLPVHVINIVKILAISLKSANPSASAKLLYLWDCSNDFVHSFTLLNSCVNPFLYACTFRQLFQNSGKQERSGVCTQSSEPRTPTQMHACLHI